jgi:hypothetical protein
MRQMGRSSVLRSPASKSGPLGKVQGRGQIAAKMVAYTGASPINEDGTEALEAAE